MEATPEEVLELGEMRPIVVEQILENTVPLNAIALDLMKQDVGNASLCELVPKIPLAHLKIIDLQGATRVV